MAFNPSKQEDLLKNPLERTNPLNEPDYAHEEGYNPFSLTQPKVLSARYGEVTPISVFETVPADRHLMSDGIKSFLDQVDSRVLSEVNAHIDYVHVPLRSIFPNNYEKIAVNPVKGDDVPFAALPQIPLLHTLYRYLDNPQEVQVQYTSNDELHTTQTVTINLSYADRFDSIPSELLALSRLLYIAFVLSRGELLDYVGFRLDDLSDFNIASSRYKRYKNVIQEKINDFFNDLLTLRSADGSPAGERWISVYGLDLSGSAGFNSNFIDLSNDELATTGASVKLRYVPSVTYSEAEQSWKSDFELSSLRAAIFDCIERGLLPVLKFFNPETAYEEEFLTLSYVGDDLYRYFCDTLLVNYMELPLDSVEDFDEYFDAGFINPARLVAYQQAVAEYMSNDRIDNVFSAELWMQNMRALMYPSNLGLTFEPTFKYNGVDYEYDMFTTGGFRRAFFDPGNLTGLLTRMTPFLSNLFILRRSLRFGDYFASGRPNLLAVGDLSIPVDQQNVSPIDVTKGLMLQRFFNAVNRWGMRFANYMASLFGVKPSDTGCSPSYVCHRTVSMNDDTVANTAGDQGKVTTNLVGTSSNYMFDVFVDDFGIMVGMLSYDTMAYYPSGVDRALRHADRFSMFNPMLQNIGDQPIRLDELTGDVVNSNYAQSPFAYATRYQEYKMSFPVAHGAFVNDVPAQIFVYPYRQFIEDDGTDTIRINPDFIRDCPFYLDPFKKSLTGLSPSQYFHFTVSVNNQHSSARKMEYWPGVL